MTNKTEKRLLTLNEAAEYTGHAPGTIRNRMHRGELGFPFIKAGRKVLFDKQDLDVWISNLQKNHHN
jgi:excisionase family DNA binding protein